MKALHHGGTETRRNQVCWAQNTWNFFYAAVAEIFDESAYRRFLQRTGSSRSKESYRDFIHEREITVAQKLRCC
jgi:hypothetical protein